MPKGNMDQRAVRETSSLSAGEHDTRQITASSTSTSPRRKTMTVTATDTRQLFRNYVQAMAGQPKTEVLLDQYITDPGLKDHIRQAEAAFPSYQVIVNQMVVDGDLVACRMTFRGAHEGEFAGVPPTGRTISSDFMIFYRFEEGRIAEHWIQMDMQEVVRQLTDSSGKG
jgi:steroid delta-isomerase-like uncharacterized protein